MRKSITADQYLRLKNLKRKMQDLSLWQDALYERVLNMLLMADGKRLHKDLVFNWMFNDEPKDIDQLLRTLNITRVRRPRKK